MDAKEQSQKWQDESQAIFAHITAWRQAHPQATMAEIEQAVDEQMHQLRAQVLHDAVHSSFSPAPSEASAAETPTCPECGVRLQARGQRERHLQTQGGHSISLKRTYLSCPRCGYGLFPPG